MFKCSDPKNLRIEIFSVPFRVEQDKSILNDLQAFQVGLLSAFYNMNLREVLPKKYYMYVLLFDPVEVEKLLNFTIFKHEIMLIAKPKKKELISYWLKNRKFSSNISKRYLQKDRSGFQTPYILLQFCLFLRRIELFNSICTIKISTKQQSKLLL